MKPWEEITRNFYRRVVIVDLLKHLATLSLAAIAVIAVFLQSLAQPEISEIILIVTICAFLSCVATSSITCIFVVKNINIDRPSSKYVKKISNFIWLSIGTFLFAIVSLCFLIVSKAIQ